MEFLWWSFGGVFVGFSLYIDRWHPCLYFVYMYFRECEGVFEGFGYLREKVSGLGFWKKITAVGDRPWTFFVRWSLCELRRGGGCCE